jgi:cell wall-associated NlpC family hydrolase
MRHWLFMALGAVGAACATAGATAVVSPEPWQNPQAQVDEGPVLPPPPPIPDAEEDTSWATWTTFDVKTAVAPQALAAKASSMVGLNSVRLVAPHLPDDCAGMVRSVYEEHGVRLMGLAQRGDNAVTAMFRRALEHDAVHTHLPAPGDLVFFKETYDRNRDGKANDGLTHVAIVESVSDDGRVSYVHRSGLGIGRSRLSLAAPFDRTMNDFVRPASARIAAATSGELFVAFAAADKLLAKVESPAR